MELVNDIAEWIQANRFEICLAWMASLLVTYGRSIETFTKNISKGWHYIFRLIFFVLVCAFGYGWVTLFCAKILSKYYSKLDDMWSIIAGVVAFILIGFLASKKKHI